MEEFRDRLGNILYNIPNIEKNSFYCIPSTSFCEILSLLLDRLDNAIDIASNLQHQLSPHLGSYRSISEEGPKYLSPTSTNRLDSGIHELRKCSYLLRFSEGGLSHVNDFIRETLSLKFRLVIFCPKVGKNIHSLEHDATCKPIIGEAVSEVLVCCFFIVRIRQFIPIGSIFTEALCCLDKQLLRKHTTNLGELFN